MNLPYLFAEIGVQHERNVPIAKTHIAAAAEAGADAVKFQAYRADWLTTKDAPPYWDTQALQAETQWEYFKRTEALSVDAYRELEAYARNCGVEFLITAFDEWLVDQLDPLVPFWKIASGDITHQALVQHIASKGKSVLLSTGASTLAEIERARCWLMAVPVTLLHCVLSYPTRAQDANLAAIRVLQEHFPDCAIGWSDHISDRSVVPLAWLAGAQVIEKHFALGAGGDAFHAWTPASLRQDVQDMRAMQQIFGEDAKRVLPCEEAARVGARRSPQLVDGEYRMVRPGPLA